MSQAAASCQPSSLLVGVPFTASDIGAMERGWRLWQHFPPLLSDSADGPGLLYLFNGRCAGNGSAAAAAACGRVQQQVQRTTHIKGRRAFGRVIFEEAQLSGRSDAYDKRRHSASWTMGPNNMFHHLVQRTRRLGYSHLLQLEPDVLPIRAGWLERAACLAATSDAWVIGSALHANCSHDGRTGRCERELPERFAGHINGNAIYAAADEGFASYYKAARYGQLKKLPFDLALHALRDGYDQPSRRRLMHRFQHSSFVLNMGTALPDVAALRASHPNAYLVHSSAYGKLGEAELCRLFGVEDASHGSATSQTAPPARASARVPALDLRVLARVASAERSAVVAFVAGVKYGDLCTNFIAHAKRAKLAHLLLVALDAPSLGLVQGSGVPALDATHLVSLPAGASDAFGSAAFFAVNGARYFCLLEMLRAGFHLFILDLDVVLLRDPLHWLATDGHAHASHEMLVQSDARDGVSRQEWDPGLVTRRLGLAEGRGWTYANGGVFFCRSTPRTLDLFERVWATLSAAETPPNEQDMLNRELASANKNLSWALLPVAEFPNGFVYFYRPLPALARPVLVHANWINGVREKVYHLSEAGHWALERRRAPRRLSVRDSCAAPCDVHSALRALRDALAIAHLLNRTLVLPRIPLQSQRPAARSRTIAHFLDYRSLAEHFPHHAPHGPDDEPPPGAVRVHIDAGGGDAPAAHLGFATVGAGWGASAFLGEEQLRRWLAPFASAAEIHLSATHRRFGSFAARRKQSEFARRLSRGLKLAPRLLTVAHAARAALARLGEYDCVDASQSTEYELLLQAASAPAGTLGAAARRLASRSQRVLVVGAGSQEERDRAARALPRSVHVGAYVPRWLVTDYDTVESNATEALAAVEAEVCAHAQRFIGNLAAASTHAICRRRRASERRRPRQAAAAGRLACEDALGRTLPSALAKVLME